MEQAYLILSGRPWLLPLMLMFLLGASELPGPLQPPRHHLWRGALPSSLGTGDSSSFGALFLAQGTRCLMRFWAFALVALFRTLGSSGLGSHRSNMRPLLATSGERDLWVVLRWPFCSAHKAAAKRLARFFSLSSSTLS